MSLILEALKKSEAERRVGQPPGLLSQAYAAEPARRVAWPWLFIGLLPLLIAAAWWFGRASAPAPETSPEPVALGQAAPSTPPTAPATGKPAPPTSATDPAAKPARPSRPPPALRQLPPPSSELTGAEREAGPVSAAEGEALLRSASAPPPTASAAPAPPAVVESEAGLPKTAAEPVSPSSAEPAQRDAPELRDLAPSLRADLPPLRVSMHVFDADPQRRFVLVDGRRLSEGDVLGEGLLLIEIRREGSLLEFRGQRFFLPRPG